jgi:hypothetical protein
MYDTVCMNSGESTYKTLFDLKFGTGNIISTIK